MSADDPYGGRSGRGALGWALKQLAIWGGLTFAVYAAIGNRAWFDPPQPAAPVRQPAAAAAPSRGAGLNSIVYHADKRGHVYLDAVVNGAPVRFVVDTGATFVALTSRDAAAAGITRGDLASTVALSTANGVVHAGRTSLRELRVGQLAVSDVPAVVQDNLGMSLLGQSFLTRLDGYEMRDGVLTLNYW